MVIDLLTDLGEARDAANAAEADASEPRALKDRSPSRRWYCGMAWLVAQ